MARRSDICEVPGCTNEIHNIKRQLCSACASSVYYWNRRESEEQGALISRREKLDFWNRRFDWLFEAPKPKKRTKRKKR